MVVSGMSEGLGGDSGRCEREWIGSGNRGEFGRSEDG